MRSENQTSVRRRTGSRWALVAAIVAATHTAPAFAYLDPGSGSIIVQGFLAAIAAVVAAGGMFWHRIKTRLASLFPRKKPPASDSSQSSED